VLGQRLRGLEAAGVIESWPNPSRTRLDLSGHGGREGRWPR
jgi:hypothetical protein